MKKLICVVVALSFFLLSSCAYGKNTDNNLTQSNSIEKTSKQEVIANTHEYKKTDVDDSVEKFIDAFNKRDKEAITQMFSVNSLAQIEDIDSQIEQMFEFVNDNIVSYDKNKGSETDSFNYGDYWKEKQWWNYFYTSDSTKYVFYFIEHSDDNTNSDNVGLNSVRIYIENDDFDLENFKEYASDLGIIVFYK